MTRITGVTTPRAAPGVLALWLAVKLLSTWWWVLHPDEVSDTAYYFTSAQGAMAGAGIDDTLREYPTPAALVLVAPVAMGIDHVSSYRTVVLLGMALADLLFTVLLVRRVGRGAAVAWIAMTAALGSMPLLRFDILPAVVAGAAALALTQQRDRVGAALVALGTGLKVWPIVLSPLLAARGRRLSGFATFVGTGLALVAVTLPLGGFDRLLSPLGYQGERGLQIESVAAVVPMMAWASDERYRVWYAPSKSYEIKGPGVDTWISLTGIASVMGALGCLALLGLWLYRGAPRQALPWLALTFAGTFVVTSKALSPQYLLWLAALGVVVLARTCDDASAHPTARAGAGAPAAPRGAVVTVGALVALCVVTTVIYPVCYPSLLSRQPNTELVVALLATRNLALVAFVGWCAVIAMGVTRRASRAGIAGVSR